MKGPDGKEISLVDSDNGAQGPEPILLVAEVAGVYTLTVHSTDKQASPGRYQVRVVNSRSANDAERTLYEAHKLFYQSIQLRRQAMQLRQEAEAGRAYVEAHKSATRALELREKVLGAEHADVAEAYSNLALIYVRTANLDKAESSYRRAIEIYEKAHGSESVEVARCLEGLGLNSNAR